MSNNCLQIPIERNMINIAGGRELLSGLSMDKTQIFMARPCKEKIEPGACRARLFGVGLFFYKSGKNVLYSIFLIYNLQILVAYNLCKLN